MVQPLLSTRSMSKPSLLRRLRVPAIASLIVGCSLTNGCSSHDDEEQGWTLNEDARLAPREVSDAAEVDDNQIVLARTEANEAWAKTLSPGYTIAGNYDTRARDDLAKSKNRHGFLRKVVSVEMNDGIVITTTPAMLYDLLQGRVHMDDKVGLPIFPDAPKAAATTQSKNLRTLDSSSGKGPKSPTKGTLGIKDVRVETDGDFEIDTHFDADFEVKREWIVPVGVKGHAHFDATAIASASIALSGTITGSASGTVNLAAWPDIPIGESGLSLQVTPQISCDYIKGEGTLGVKATGTLTGKLSTGFDFDGTTATPIAGMGLKPEFKLEGQAGPVGLNVSCGIKVDATLWALEAVGISLSMGPKVIISAKECTSTSPNNGSQGSPTAGTDFSLESGLYVTGKLKAKTPIIPVVSVEATLFNDEAASFGKADSGCCTFSSGIQLVCDGQTPIVNP